MTTFAGMLKRLDSLSILNEAMIILSQNKTALAEANRLQWRMGERSTGEKIGKYKYLKYAKAKNTMNPLAGLGNIDLTLTKKTAKSIFVDITKDSMIFKIGDDEHQLESRFGDDIIGLSDKSKKAFIEVELLPELIKRIQEITGMQ